MSNKRFNKLFLKRTVVTVFCFAVNMSSLWAATDEWPMFKNDLAHSSVNPTDTLATPFTLKWNGSVNLGSVNAVAYSSPVVLNAKTYIGCIDGNIYSFNNGANGSLIWNYKTSASIYGSPAVATIGGIDYAFIGSTDGNLYCFSASITPVTAPAWVASMGGPIFTSPLVIPETSAGITLVICASHSGIINAFNALTGAQVWTLPVTLSNNYLFASPAYDTANDVVFEPSYDGNLYALHALTGLSAWANPVTVGPTHSSPAVTANYLYNLSNSGVLTCLFKATGKVKASVFIGSTATSSPAAFRINGTANDTIITCGQNGMVELWTLADSASNFVQAWQRQLPDSINSSPAVSSANLNSLTGGAIYVGCNDKNLYTLNLVNGTNLAVPINLNKTVQISPAVAEGNLFISSSAGLLKDFYGPTANTTITPTPTATSTPTLNTTATATYTPTPTATINFLACASPTPLTAINAYGVALDGAGNTYVTDDLDSLVNVFSLGQAQNPIGGPGAQNGHRCGQSGQYLCGRLGKQPGGGFLW